MTVMGKDIDNNVEYYNKNADSFFTGSVNADMAEDRGERLFSDFDEKSVVPLFENVGFEIVSNSVGPDSRPGRETEYWVSVLGVAR